MGASAWFGLLGLIGNLVRPILLPVAAIGFGLSLLWHGRHSGLIPFARRSVEANKNLVRGLPGLLYFGALLGVGVITEMSTPLVWAGAVYSAAIGLPGAVFYGLGFGLGRSTPALVSAVRYRKDIDYAAVSAFIVGSIRQPLRYIALIAALAGMAISTAGLLVLTNRHLM
jgi:hypothetical protein